MKDEASVSWRWKLAAGAGGTALFGIGLYVGIELAKPPPRPDLRSVRGETAPGARRVPAASGASTAPEPRQRPRIALVIDDLGRSLDELDDLAALRVPLTYAVLPFEPKTPEVVAALQRRGEEILCHLPMEAKGEANPGPGALRIAMDVLEIRAATLRALAAVPGAAGVNNHMGSRISSQREPITAVLRVVADRGLYYLDSRTSADTLGFTVARELGIPSGERHVFLDTERDPVWIRGQLDQLVSLAESRGGAIAIAHPYPETLDVLRQGVDAARRRGIEFVRVSSLLQNGA